jgi:hypothetical protein
MRKRVRVHLPSYKGVREWDATVEVEEEEAISAPSVLRAEALRELEEIQKEMGSAYPPRG